MSTPQTTEDLKRWYEEAARAYLRTLSPEHFMESVEQATQRKITVESFDLVQVHRPDVQTFNELLVQYPDPNGRTRKPRQVVPDNMNVLCDQAIVASGSYDVALQPAGPFCVMEYVSKNSVRKDYEDNMEKYERHLKVPYYLLFYPDNQELTLYRHTGEKYVTVLPNEQDRYPIPEMEVEAALLDGWVRFWFRGKLLPLPAELQMELNRVREEAAEANRRADEATRRAEKAIEDANTERKARLAAEAELERLRGLLKQQGGDTPSA
jgi:Uma2 family endonuclease